MAPSQNRPQEPAALEALKEQQANLKLTVDDLQIKLGRTRSLIKTLLFGLVIATFFGLGLTGWLAYRLLLQQEVAKRDLEQATVDSAELQEQLEEIETEIQTQSRQVRTLRENLSTEVELLTETAEANQRQLDRLRDRLQNQTTPEGPAGRSEESPE